MSARRILVVDDDRDVVVFLSRLLQRAGYAVLTAQDALQAVMQAHRESPDLVLTDIAMPAGGGQSVLDRLRGSEKTSAIPIIALTGTDGPQLEARGLANGATRLVAKRCDNTVLLESIRAALGEGQ